MEETVETTVAHRDSARTPCSESAAWVVVSVSTECMTVYLIDQGRDNSA